MSTPLHPNLISLHSPYEKNHHTYPYYMPADLSIYGPTEAYHAADYPDI